MSNALAVFKTKPSARFARKARISEQQLWDAAVAAGEGLVDADLGGGVVKQRIARAGQGKSVGSRTILCVRRGRRAVYVFGFEKKDLSNITEDDLLSFREFAKVVLAAADDEVERWVREGALLRIEPVESD